MAAVVLEVLQTGGGGSFPGVCLVHSLCKIKELMCMKIKNLLSEALGCLSSLPKVAHLLVTVKSVA